MLITSLICFFILEWYLQIYVRSTRFFLCTSCEPYILFLRCRIYIYVHIPMHLYTYSHIYFYALDCIHSCFPAPKREHYVGKKIHCAVPLNFDHRNKFVHLDVWGSNQSRRGKVKLSRQIISLLKSSKVRFWTKDGWEIFDMAWSSMSVKHPAQRSTIQTLASAVLCVSVSQKMHNETKWNEAGVSPRSQQNRHGMTASLVSGAFGTVKTHRYLFR